MKQNANMITMTATASNFFELKSWDKLRIPKPFGTIQLIVSPPLNISEKPETAKEEVKLLSDFMNQYQDEADRLTGKIN